MGPTTHLSLPYVKLELRRACLIFNMLILINMVVYNLGIWILGMNPMDPNADLNFIQGPCNASNLYSN